MEQLGHLVGTLRAWNEARKVYEPVRPLDLAKSSTLDFGNISINIEAKPPIADSFDSTPSITLRKKEGLAPAELHIIELRSSYDKPKKYVVGQTIMKESPFFYFSNLGDLVGLQIYKGNPETHPEMLEITPATKIGENTSSPLL